MQGAEQYVNERLEHLGIVAGVCQEIGLAAWLDAQEPGNRLILDLLGPLYVKMYNPSG